MLIEKMLAQDNIAKAIEHLSKKPEQCGIDGQKIKDLKEYWNLNSEQIISKIKRFQYRCGKTEEHQIVTCSGKIRWISRMNSIDRMLLRALHQVLEEILDKSMCEFSYGFRQQLGISDAAEKAKRYIESGNEFIGSLDLKDYFDNISHNRLLEKLRVLNDDMVTRLIHNLISCDIVRDGMIYKKSQGLLQGSPLSPLLANFYLCDFDKYMISENVKFIRYADDIKIFAENEENCYSYLVKAKSFLESDGLVVNNKKTVVNVFNQVFLTDMAITSEVLILNVKKKLPRRQ